MSKKILLLVFTARSFFRNGDLSSLRLRSTKSLLAPSSFKTIYRLFFSVWKPQRMAISNEHDFKGCFVLQVKGHRLVFTGLLIGWRRQCFSTTMLPTIFTLFQKWCLDIRRTKTWNVSTASTKFTATTSMLWASQPSSWFMTTKCFSSGISTCKVIGKISIHEFTVVTWPTEFSLRGREFQTVRVPKSPLKRIFTLNVFWWEKFLITHLWKFHHGTRNTLIKILPRVLSVIDLDPERDSYQLSVGWSASSLFNENWGYTEDYWKIHYSRQFSEIRTRSEMSFWRLYCRIIGCIIF